MFSLQNANATNTALAAGDGTGVNTVLGEGMCWK